MFVGVQVDIEGEGWMVRVVDKCYYCIYERDNLLDVIINYLLLLLLLFEPQGRKFKLPFN